MHLKRQWIVSQEDNSGLQMTRRQPYDCMRPLNCEKEQRRPILECNYLDNKGFGTVTLNINSLFFHLNSAILFSLTGLTWSAVLKTSKLLI